MALNPASTRWELPANSVLPGYPRVLGQILASRGYDADGAAAIIAPPLVRHDPFDMANMAAAVDAVVEALREHRRIAVYGDYDCDGVTACAILVRALRATGADVVPYIPNRMTEGYGLHADALQHLAAQDVGCVISVDCGTSSVDAAASRPANMLLAITDHHLPLRRDGVEQIAGADAVVNPKQASDAYPFDGLAGAGVALKLVEALEARGAVAPGTAASLVGLAALGTIGDVMPLVDENRTIVAEGLKSLAQRPFPGVAALSDRFKLGPAPTAQDLAFSVIPCINAAGRMEDAKLALDLCLSDSATDSEQLADRLVAQNQARKATLQTAMVAADEMAAALPADVPAIVIGSPDWPMGIVGLIASRLADKYARPVLVVSLQEPEAKGSARSQPGVHIVDALAQASDTMLRYGGHAMAAGFSLEPQRFEQFQAAVIAAVAQQVPQPGHERITHIDCLLEGREATPYLARIVNRMQPFGMANREPLFALLGARVLEAKPVGHSGQHWNVRLMARDGSVVDVIAWNRPDLPQQLFSIGRDGRRSGRKVDLCVTADLNSWVGRDGVRRESLRLKMLDLRDAMTLEPPAPSLD